MIDGEITFSSDWLIVDQEVVEHSGDIDIRLREETTLDSCDVHFRRELDTSTYHWLG